MFLIGDLIRSIQAPLLIAAFLVALPAGTWLLGRLYSSSFRYLLFDPFSDLALYARAIWWATYWTDPGPSMAERILCGIRVGGLLFLLLEPLFWF